METRVQLKSIIKNNNVYYFYKKLPVRVDFIRIIFPDNDLYTIKINNNKSLCFYNIDGICTDHSVRGEFDEIEKYYYYDVKFLDYIKINQILVSCADNKKDLSKNIYIEFDKDYNEILDENEYKYYYEGDLSDVHDDTKEFYIALVNKNEAGKDIEDDEILTINDHEDFDVKKVKDNIYKVTLINDYEIDFITFSDPNVCFVMSELPLATFPINIIDLEKA